MLATKKLLLAFGVFVVFLSISGVHCIPVSEDEDSDGDVESQDDTRKVYSKCDCEDPGALYYKIIRQFMNQRDEGTETFLEEFRPKRVCGSDGILYISKCALECAKLKDSELHIFQTACNQNRAKKHKKKQSKNMKLQKISNEATPIEGDINPGKERIEPPRVCICTRQYAPVCASNGITYGNKCVFECAKENMVEQLTIVRDGSCDDNPDAETFLQRQIK